VTKPSREASISSAVNDRGITALNSLDPIDREMLALRRFELLSRADAAQLLAISQETVATRYFCALKRLKDIVATMPGGWEGA
jgi:RNA polymerase sigma-70 factor (ECF subfamily)